MGQRDEFAASLLIVRQAARPAAVRTKSFWHSDKSKQDAKPLFSTGRSSYSHTGNQPSGADKQANSLKTQRFQKHHKKQQATDKQTNLLFFLLRNGQQGGKVDLQDDRIMHLRITKDRYKHFNYTYIQWYLIFMQN